MKRFAGGKAIFNIHRGRSCFLKELLVAYLALIVFIIAFSSFSWDDSFYFRRIIRCKDKRDTKFHSNEKSIPIFYLKFERIILFIHVTLEIFVDILTRFRQLLINNTNICLFDSNSFKSILPILTHNTQFTQKHLLKKWEKKRLLKQQQLRHVCLYYKKHNLKFSWNKSVHEITKAF